MLRIAKLTDYATLVLQSLPAHDTQQLASATELAKQLQLELPTVSKVLKLLARGSLVDSVRGAHGGYRLAKSLNVISVADVIQVMEGPIALTECCETHSDCQQQSHCQLKGNWQRISGEIAQVLSRITIADLSADDSAQNLAVHQRTDLKTLASRPESH